MNISTPPALNGCPKCKKSPNLVTLTPRFTEHVSSQRIFAHFTERFCDFMRQVNNHNGQWLWLSWQSGRFHMFESSHWQTLYRTSVYCQDENKEKEAGNGTFKKYLNTFANIFCKKFKRLKQPDYFFRKFPKSRRRSYILKWTKGIFALFK